MTRTEERLADALGAAASAVREDSLRPLTVREGHPPPARAGWRRSPPRSAWPW